MAYGYAYACLAMLSPDEGDPDLGLAAFYADALVETLDFAYKTARGEGD